MSDVMEMRVETEAFVAGRVQEDRDLRDDVARGARRPGWYSLIVVLDALAIVAFITWVVVPRLS
ncbi:MAG TPA: hypothetical protein VF108_10445 [Actinomycetota bacterium]